MSGDESQTGLRGGVTQITLTDGQREGSKVSDLCVCVSVKMIYPGKKKKKDFKEECACVCVWKYEWESETRGPDLEQH